MIIEILFTIALIYLLIGSYTDLKSREVPDIVNFSLVAIALAANVMLSILFADWSYILFSLVGLAAAVCIALLMYYTGQWGGGDAKMLFGLGALFGLPIFPKTIFAQWQYNPPLLLTFFLYIFVIGGMYGLVWSIYLTIKSWKEFVVAFTQKIHEKQIMVIRKILLASSIIIISAVFFVNNIALKLLLITLLLFLMITFYLYIFIKLIEKIAMLKKINASQLTEGDWIAEDIVVDDQYITGPKDLGVDKKQIQTLVELQKTGKIHHVIIKQGIPFIPSFLITLLVSYFIGLGWLMKLLLGTS